MRALLLLLAACTVSAGPQPAHYAEPAAPVGWCTVGAGAYALATQPNTVPSLVTGCGLPNTNVGPNMSTFSQLVIDPGSVVEILVALPDSLQGCMLDSVVLVHGRANDGLAVDVRVGDTVTPVLAYSKVPGMYAQRVNDRLPPDVDLYAVRHRIGLAAQPVQSIVLHAEHGFSLGVRTDREVRGEPLVLDGKPTQYVAQAAIVVTHCRLPADVALDTLTRKPTVR